MKVRTPDWRLVCAGIDWITVDDLFAMCSVFAKRKRIPPTMSFLLVDMLEAMADMPVEEVRSMLLEARKEQSTWDSQ